MMGEFPDIDNTTDFLTIKVRKSLVLFFLRRNFDAGT